MVGHPLARHATGDQQQPVHARQSRLQGLREGVVGLPYLHTTRGQVGDLATVAHHSDNVGWEHPASQQLLNRETPKVA